MIRLNWSEKIADKILKDAVSERKRGRVLQSIKLAAENQKSELEKSKDKDKMLEDSV